MNSLTSSVLESLSTHHHLSFATQIQISNRERRQKIALKCLELENMLETKGMSAHEIEAKVSNFRMLLLRQTPLTAGPLSNSSAAGSNLFSTLPPNLQSHLHRHLPNSLLSTRAALQFLKAETRKTLLADKLPRKEIIDPYYRRIYRRKKKRRDSSRHRRSDRKRRGSSSKKKRRKSSRKHYSDNSDYSDEDNKSHKGKRKRKYDYEDNEDKDDEQEDKNEEISSTEGPSKDRKRSKRKKSSSRKRSRSRSRGRSRTRKSKKKKKRKSTSESKSKGKSSEAPNEFKNQESKSIVISKIEDLPTLADEDDHRQEEAVEVSISRGSNSLKSPGKILPFEIPSKTKIISPVFNSEEVTEEKKKLKFPKFLPKISSMMDDNTDESYSNSPEGSNSSFKKASARSTSLAGDKDSNNTGESMSIKEDSSSRKSRSRSRESRSYSRGSSYSRSPSSSSRSRSRSIPIRNGSPSFLEKRRITSARKRPIPYTRANHSSSEDSNDDDDDYDSSYYCYSSSRSRSRSSWSRSSSRSRSRSRTRSRSRSYSFSP